MSIVHCVNLAAVTDLIGSQSRDNGADIAAKTVSIANEPVALRSSGRERPDKLYGQSIKSNYQGQGLKLAKQFF